MHFAYPFPHFLKGIPVPCMRCRKVVRFFMSGKGFLERGSKMKNTDKSCIAENVGALRTSSDVCASCVRHLGRTRCCLRGDFV